MKRSLFTDFGKRGTGMHRLCSLVAAFLMLLSVLPGCAHKNQETEQNAGTQILEHVFRGTEFALPGNYSVRAADYDPDADVLRCAVSIWPEDPAAPLTYASLEMTEEGISSSLPIDLGDGHSVKRAVYVGDSLWMILPDGSDETLKRFDLKTGETDEGIGLKAQFSLSGGDSVYVQHFTADSEGNLYLYTFPEILILSPEAERLGLVQIESLNGLAADGEGRVWAWGRFHDRLSMAEVKPGSQEIDKAIALPNGTRKLFFAPGHDLYVMTDSGIDGYEFGEDGNLSETGEPVVSFVNSDIGLAMTDVLSLLSPELFLASESGEDHSVTHPVLYRHAEDIDLSAVTTVRVAVSVMNTVADTVRMKAVLFNKNHKDVRVVIDNYSPTEDGPNLYNNENRLALALTTGTYKPDLVICMPDGPVFKVGADHGLFRDLTSFTERPGLLNRDNILGCVKRIYTDRDGRLFALTDRLYEMGIETILAATKMLGQYADKGSWTLGEFLDFAESLPEDVVLMENLTRESAPRKLFGAEGYAAFIDMENGICSFDDGVFARYLRFLASLPTREEYRTHSPYDLAGLGEADKFPYYRDGKIALASVILYSLSRFVEVEAIIGTKDWRMIGKPTNSGYGTPIKGRAVFAMTAADDGQAEKAWEVLEALMTPAQADKYGSGIPSFVGEFESDLNDLLEKKFYIGYGARGTGMASKDYEWPEEYMRNNPGIETALTEEDADRLRDLFENRLGVPYDPAVSEDVVAIVNEEVSAFLGGLGTAEDCAAKIQSRVSIWLAERQ